MMANGYNGKILRVNLTQGTTSVEQLEEASVASTWEEPALSPITS